VYIERKTKSSWMLVYVQRRFAAASIPSAAPIHRNSMLPKLLGLLSKKKKTKKTKKTKKRVYYQTAMMDIAHRLGCCKGASMTIVITVIIVILESK
jgi:hypothetical protein